MMSTAAAKASFAAWKRISSSANMSSAIRWMACSGLVAWKVVNPGWSDICARNSAIATSPVRTSPTISQRGDIRSAASTPSRTVKGRTEISGMALRASSVTTWG